MKDDLLLYVVLITLGVLQFGWLIWPSLAELNALISAVLVLSIVGAAIWVKLSKRADNDA